MVTVKQLIEKLQTLNPDLQVRVLTGFTHEYSSTTEWVDLDIRNYSDNFYARDKYLDLGQK